MVRADSHVGVLFEHPEWFRPLFAELDRRGLAHDRVELTAHRFDPVTGGVPWTTVLNRMSPSAHLRGHGRAIGYTKELLPYLEEQGVQVINGSRAFALETSKVAQLRLLARLGLHAPRTRVINNPALASEAAAGLDFPVAVKPNIGGSGAGIQRFDSPAALDEAVDEGRVDLGVDGAALVQEFLPARGGPIVRVEVLGGEFLYAIKVFPNPEAGFNLCPADICRPGETAADETGRAADETVPVPSGAPSAGDPAGSDLDFCPVDLPKTALRIEATVPPQPVIDAVLTIAEEAGFDLGGVEYLVNDRDGQVYFYDINALSNFVTDARSIVGFDPYARLVDFLERRTSVPVPAVR
jgi:hypothetical protein